MTYELTVQQLRRDLGELFVALDRWFERDPSLRGHQPSFGGWTADQVLEHVTLTNHFLLLTLAKWVRIAERRRQRGSVPEIADPGAESDLTRLEAIGRRGSFSWACPAHMEPTGVPTSQEVRLTLLRQRDECTALLGRMENGAGALCRIRMSVHHLDKIDLYQWLAFLLQHQRRHLMQLEAIAEDFVSQI